VYLTVILITAGMNVWAAAADFLRAKFVLRNSDELGVPRSWVLPLGLLKLAGAIGLVGGLLNMPLLGIAAAGGLVLFFLGALIVHVRARVFHNIVAPAVFFLAAVASLLVLVQEQ
jgi:hypothetical protein